MMMMMKERGLVIGNHSKLNKLNNYTRDAGATQTAGQELRDQ